MSVLIVLPILAANALVALRDPRRGVFLYAGLSLLLPHPSVAGASVPYEMLGLPGVLLAVFYVRRSLRHPRLHVLLASYLALLLASTVIGTMTYGSDLNAVRILGILRVLILFGLFAETLDRRGIETLLLTVVAANAVIGFAQLVVPGGAELTLRLYGREGGTVLERYVEWGSIPRASGTFTSPIILGAVALVALAVGWAGILAKEGHRKTFHTWLLLSSSIAGILTLTKTFILGAPLVLLAGLALRGWADVREGRLQPRLVVALGTVIAVGLGATIWMAIYLAGLGLPVEYYAGFLTDPLSAFGGRYGPGSLLEDAAGVIGENLFIGVGLTKVRGEFLGDSLYLSILHGTGLVGATLLLGVVALIVRRLVVVDRPLKLLILFALLLTGLSIDVVFKLPGALTIAYLLSMGEEAAGQAVADASTTSLTGLRVDGGVRA